MVAAYVALYEKLVANIIQPEVADTYRPSA
jgi:hypothetical protein